MVDSQFTILLQRQHRHLLNLRHRWTNAFASAVRFDWHVQNAVQVANQVTDNTTPLRVVWMPVWTEKDNVQNNDTATVFSTDSDTVLDEDDPPSADSLLVADALEHEVEMSEEIDGSVSGVDPLVTLVWQTPVRSRELCLSTNHAS